MNTYPTLPQAEGTKLVPRAGLHLRYASNGSVRSRATSSATRYDPAVQHNLLALADWQTLQAFYEANRAVPFTLNYLPLAENLSLTVLFAEKPFDYKFATGGTVDVTVYMVQAT